MSYSRYLICTCLAGFSSCIYFAMGRAPKASASSEQRHDPLGVQLRTDTSGLLSQPGRREKKNRHKIAAEEVRLATAT